MSVSHTTEAVRRRQKTVTRRLGWRFLKVGDRLTLCEQVMGRRGAPLVRLAEVEVVSVRREKVLQINDHDILCEGVEVVPGRFCEIRPDTGQPYAGAWAVWFCKTFGGDFDTEVTRIEWKYLEEATQP